MISADPYRALVIDYIYENGWIRFQTLFSCASNAIRFTFNLYVEMKISIVQSKAGAKNVCCILKASLFSAYGLPSCNRHVQSMSISNYLQVGLFCAFDFSLSFEDVKLCAPFDLSMRAQYGFEIALCNNQSDAATLRLNLTHFYITQVLFLSFRLSSCLVFFVLIINFSTV